MQPQYVIKRKTNNEKSKQSAEHDKEPWSAYEVEFLMTHFEPDDQVLAMVAELLGRTIEACRQKFYVTAKTGNSTMTVTTQTTTATYRGWMEGMGEE